MTTITNATIKQILAAQNDKPIVIHAAYLRLTPDHAVAAALSQVIYWHGVMKGKKFYKTNDDFAAELRLTSKQFERVKIVLKALPFLTITREKIPARTVYDVNYEKLAQALKDETIPSLSIPEITTPIESSYPQKGVTSSTALVASSSPLLGVSNTENTPEITQNNNTAPQSLPKIAPTLEPVVVETLEKIFSGAQLNQSKTYIAEISTVFQLQVLTTVLLRLSNKNKEPVENKIALLRSLITSVKDGTFTPPPAAVKPVSSEEIMRREKRKQEEAAQRTKVDNVAFFADMYKKMKGNFEIPEPFKQAVFERLGLAYG